MHNTFRGGADLELTFKLQMRRMTADPSQVLGKPPLDASRGKDDGAPKGVRAWTRSLLRSLLSAVGRRLEPALHPLLLRLRKFFTAPVEEEMEAVKAKLQHEIRTHVAELAARLDRRVVACCGSEEVLVRTDVGYVVCVPRDHALLIRLLEGGRGDGTLLLIQRLLKPGDVFIDVGADVGVDTLAAARAMQGIGRIVAFEPCEPTRRRLEKSVELNGFSRIVEIHQVAVSNLMGRQRVVQGAARDHHTRSSLPVQADMHRAPIDVECVTLDEIMASEPVVSLIRINVHGAELDVLDGSRSLIQRNEEMALVVNFERDHLRRTGRTTREWLARFEALGLVPRVIDDETGVAASWSAEKLEHVESVDLLFARPGVEVWRKAETWG